LGRKGIAAEFDAGHSPGAHLCQLRIAFYLQAPPLIIGQMPVETVELVESHPVQQFFKLGGRIEMTGYVQHESPVMETRPVFDSKTGQHRRNSCFVRKELEQRLYPVKQTGSFSLQDN